MRKTLPMRDSWKQQLESLEAFVERYRLLLAALRDPYFDEDDRKRVQMRLTTFKESLVAAKLNCEQREKLYEGSVKQLAEVLEKRQSLLEEVDQKTRIFDVDQELLEFFVGKQQQLQEKLKEVLQKLDELPGFAG